jgi:hypothetical protein
MIGRLLGHKNPQTTARYAHLAHDPVRELADHTSRAIKAALQPTAHPEAQDDETSLDQPSP